MSLAINALNGAKQAISSIASRFSKAAPSFAEKTTISPHIPTAGISSTHEKLLPGLLQGKRMVSGGEADVFFNNDKVLKWLRPADDGTFGYSPRASRFFKFRDAARPLFNVQAQLTGTKDVSSLINTRNLVPEMPQMVDKGLLGGRPLIEQPVIKGFQATYSDIADWFKRNNVVSLRKAETPRRMMSVTPDGKYLPTRAGIARVKDPNDRFLGLFPKSKYMLMDDIKPANFMFDAQAGKAVPIDVMASVIPRMQALMAVPQLREEFIRRLTLKLGAGAAVGAGAYTVNRS
jgi:hypothetical protein